MARQRTRNLQVERVETERTVMIQINTPRSNPNYQITARRERLISDNGDPEVVVGHVDVYRGLFDVAIETVTVNGKTLSVAELATAVSMLIDRWAEEDVINKLPSP
jgi:hypothetical protein